MAIRGDLPADLKAAVKRFLLNYKEADYFQYMLGLSPSDKPEFVEASDRDYDYVRDLMAKVMPR
jgi:ABC-type phosphate/phosphonate transport system substrate-binding protein